MVLATFDAIKALSYAISKITGPCIAPQRLWLQEVRGVPPISA